MTTDRTRPRIKKKNKGNGKDWGQNKSGEQGFSNSGHHSRKPSGMEGKCMRCQKHEHQLGQRCPAKNAKCKDCHKIGHFHKVCQSKKKPPREPALFRATKTMMTPTLIKMESDNPIHLQG